MSVKRKRNSIGGAWVAHSLEMRRSPAWRNLPDPARRALFRVEEEHMSHGGADNGNLPVTYSDFTGAGIRRASIALALRQAVELGFLTITRPGGRSISDVRLPSLYGLTYVVTRNKTEKPDTWKSIRSDEHATIALTKAAAERRYTTQAPARPLAQRSAA